MGVKIHKCGIPWNEIQDDQTQNLCAHCQICVPDLSNQSMEKIDNEFPDTSCARVHDRHLEENEKEFFVVNRLEAKLRNLGWLRLASVTVFVYLLVTGCHTRRTAGVPAYSKNDYLEKIDNGERSQNSEMPAQVDRN